MASGLGSPPNPKDDMSARPPLPPRPRTTRADTPRSTTSRARQVSYSSSSPQRMQSKPTTAVSLTDVLAKQTQDDLTLQARITHRPAQIECMPTIEVSSLESEFAPGGPDGLILDDTASIFSTETRVHESGDLESLYDGVSHPKRAAIDSPDTHPGLGEFRWRSILEARRACFEAECRVLSGKTSMSQTQATASTSWATRLKHFFILSKAGKPIYSRHGDDSQLSVHLGVLHTIISSYESSGEDLESFTFNESQCVVLSRGPLILVALSRLNETEAQVGLQLEALFNQILSTLTLPRLEQIFSNRASTDLRKHLKGTEPLLDGLADSFTRGSPVALLSAIECLKLRKTHRQLIDNTLLRNRTASLLYGLIVAQGKLASVLRPRKHSLHPGDLQLIFNMLFEAEGIKRDMEENWIPLCLPSFNSGGFVYAYVGFVTTEDQTRPAISTAVTSHNHDVATLLISADRDSFFELQGMKRAVVAELRQNSGLGYIQAAVASGRPAATRFHPESPVHHFLYKSRNNVQFVTARYEPYFPSEWDRRRLFDIYHQLHGDLHSKTNRNKVLHQVSIDSCALAWASASFELYLISASNVSKTVLGRSAAKIVQWVQSQEERLFIIGGAVF